MVLHLHLVLLIFKKFLVTDFKCCFTFSDVLIANHGLIGMLSCIGNENEA